MHAYYNAYSVCCIQWNPVNTTAFGARKCGRFNEIGSQYGATRFKHVLHLNTFTSAINQHFFNLPTQFIPTQQYVTMTSFSSFIVQDKASFEKTYSLYIPYIFEEPDFIYSLYQLNMLLKLQ